MDAARFRRLLGTWYRENGRHALPWRQTRDPYAVLVSEVMLQQTQVDRVLSYYDAWLQRWPTADALAAADPSAVIRAWSGLGYNRRAVSLRAAAAAIAAGRPGVTRDPAALQRLPGIGPYTASAVACFAHGARVAVADTNIARVLARCLAGRADRRTLTAGQVSALAESVLPARHARAHNLALMDLGATVCRARDPGCESCPLQRLCTWHASGRPEPVRATQRTPRFETTSRFARGRIVEALRSAADGLTLESIAALLPPAHAARAATHLEALARDRLAECRDGRWSLPLGLGQGSTSMASPKL
jgi:A/G-specific adenine glycosylase